MNYILIILGISLSVLLSSMIIPRILVVAYRKRLFDVPDERKVHRGVVPRLGGLSFAPTILFAVSFTTGLRYLLGYGIPVEMLDFIIPEFYFLICGLTLLYLTGIKDDLVGLRYRSKFVVQIVAASMLPLSGLWINNLYGLMGIYELPPWIGIPFTILVVVFICNAINLIDGIDGLASGLSCVSLVILGSLFVYNRLWLYGMLAFTSFGVLVPFFYYNVFGKADRCKKIFMGDTGSLTLGYILAFLVVRYIACNPNLIPYSEGSIIIAFSTLIVPLFDVVRVMLVRARNHKGIFTADKNHMHHKLLAIGLSHHKSMIYILLIACVFSALNIVAVQYLNINLIFVLDILIWVVLHLWLDKVRDGRLKND